MDSGHCSAPPQTLSADGAVIFSGDASDGITTCGGVVFLRPATGFGTVSGVHPQGNQAVAFDRFKGFFGVTDPTTGLRYETACVLDRASHPTGGGAGVPVPVTYAGWFHVAAALFGTSQPDRSLLAAFSAESVDNWIAAWSFVTTFATEDTIPSGVLAGERWFNTPAELDGATTGNPGHEQVGPIARAMIEFAQQHPAPWALGIVAPATHNGVSVSATFEVRSAGGALVPGVAIETPIGTVISGATILVPAARPDRPINMSAQAAAPSALPFLFFPSLDQAIRQNVLSTPDPGRLTATAVVTPVPIDLDIVKRSTNPNFPAPSGTFEVSEDQDDTPGTETIIGRFTTTGSHIIHHTVVGRLVCWSEVQAGPWHSVNPVPTCVHATNNPVNIGEALNTFSGAASRMTVGGTSASVVVLTSEQTAQIIDEVTVNGAATITWRLWRKDSQSGECTGTPVASATLVATDVGVLKAPPFTVTFADRGKVFNATFDVTVGGRVVQSEGCGVPAQLVLVTGTLPATGPRGTVGIAMVALLAIVLGGLLLNLGRPRRATDRRV